MDSNKGLTNKKLNEFSKVIKVQEDQKDKAKNTLENAKDAVDDLNKINSKNISDLDMLIKRSLELLDDKDISAIEANDSNIDLVSLTEEDKININKEIDSYGLDEIELIKVGESWESYLNTVEEYGLKEGLNLDSDPFRSLMTEQEEAKILSRMESEYNLRKPQCDKYDYFFAGFSGVLSGLIDVFLVGSPLYNKGKLVDLTDNQVETAVLKFSDFVYKIGGYGDGTSRKASTKIQFLENQFKVPYDATSDRVLGIDPKNLHMSTKNHHYLSLAHSPDLVGLFFSILDQFTGKGTYFSNGKIIRASYETKNPFVLKGSNTIEKLFFGAVNWLGHIMSDMAGSNASIGNNNRGSGLPIPMTQFFQLLDKVRIGEDDIAKIARKLFESGYDFRFGLTLTIPIALNELLIKFFWAIRRYAQHGESIEYIFKNQANSPELNRLLLTSYGSMCLIDGIGASVNFIEGDYIGLFSNMNLIAWTRFAFVGFKEVRSIYTRSKNREKRNNDMDKEWEALLISSQNYY